MKLPPWIRERVRLADLTTFGIGGPARWFAEPATRREVAVTLSLARELGAPVKFLGGGSNLLVADSGVAAMAVRLSPADEFGEMDMEAESPLSWRVGAAVGLQALVGGTVREGLAGLEPLAGIPGSVGGAAAMNAGGAEFGVGRFIARAEVFGPDGEARFLVPPALSFGYRTSSLSGVLAVELSFRFAEREDPERLLARLREYRDKKRANQPLGLPSAGCVFRNPPGDSAGRLLEAAGCKGMRQGGAEVSRVHANFIVNRGGASARDVATLALRMREAVVAASGIGLEPEIALWGDDPAFARLTEG